MRAWWCARCALVLLLLWVGCGGGPPVPPSPPRRTNLGVPIHAFRIANNGLRVVIVPDPKSSQVQVTMRYQVGMLDEPAGLEGVAHLAEHLMFLPVVGGAGQVVYDRLEATASWFNASTGLEATTYVSRADPRRLADLLQIEALRLGIRCKTLTDEAFVRERDVVRNELRQRAGSIRVPAALLGALYPEDHPYRRAMVADEELVGRITREETCAFIDAHYSPDNAVLIVSGNVTEKVLDEELGKLLGRVAKHPIASPPHVAPLAARPRVASTVPIGTATAVVAWPLAADPAMRARMRAVATMMASHIDSEIKGTIRVIELGGARAPAIAFAITPGPDESVETAVDEAERVALGMQVWFRSESFDRARAAAVYRLFARFEDGNARDALLADHVLAGREPVQALSTEIQALNQFTANEARDIVADQFSFAAATTVLLTPGTGRTPAAGAGAAGDVGAGAAATLEPQIHPPGEPRVREDPEAAHAEAKRTIERDPFVRAEEHTLANGLRVILMPLTSVPTVDVRLVFPVGAVDEPERQRGVALFAAKVLTPNIEDLGVLRGFYTAGGFYGVTVDRERTTFTVRGLDMYLDVLLAGLERLVRNGLYPEHDARQMMRRAVAKLGHEEALSDVWRAALFGPDHPYTRAEDWRRAEFDALDRRAVRRFHAKHFHPRGATLIVAGGFDPVVADAWINYLFGDWEAKAAVARATDRARVQPVALAQHDEDARQVAVNIAVPIGGGTRAASMVAAQMIDGAIADVRKQLGASYGLDATLFESRLSTHVRIGGFVAAERAQEALALVRERIGRLAAGDAAAAALFVAARRDVMARLASVEHGASALASLAASAVELGHPLGADLATAEDARRLTLRQMASVLGAIDLARAAVLLNGPREAVTRAYAALGRTPRVIAR
jgi:zinc protease